MNVPSMADAPFHCPPDIVVDLPPPISVNKLRKIAWGATKRRKRWVEAADALVLAARCRSLNPLPRQKILGRFEVTLTLDERQCGVDLDNAAKIAIDYLKRIELIVDDSKKYMRKVTIEWGIAPQGARITLKPLAIQSMGEVLRRAEQRDKIAEKVE